MFHVFGDESKHNSTIVYGVIALSDRCIPVVSDKINALKKHFGVPTSAEFHAKTVFHRDERVKSEWSILNEAQTFDFAEAFISLLLDQDAIFIVGAIHRDEYPSAFPTYGDIPEGVMERRQLTAVLMQGIKINLEQRLGPNNFKLWLDPDETKTLWFGKGMRADRLYRANILGKGPDNSVGLQEAGVNTPVLLEAADLFAYVCSHSLSPDDFRQKKRFESFYRLCRPTYAILTYNPEERLKTSILQIRHAQICDEVFHTLPVGACIWRCGHNRISQSYPCVLMKVPKGQAQKIMDSRKVEIRATVRNVGNIPMLLVLFRFIDE